MKRRSLRVQLILLGLATAVIPIGVLVAVVFVTESNVETTPASTNASRSVEITETGGVSLWVPLAAALLASAASWGVWRWSGRAVSPVSQLTAVADRIQAGSLEERIGLDGAPGELQALADSFDRMLERLSIASTLQERLIEETSHELRTPLSVIAANAEVILAHPNPNLDDYRTATEQIEATTERLLATIDALLHDSRVRSRRTAQLDTDLISIAHRVAAQHRTLHPGVAITVAGPDRLHLGIDGPSIERAISNLVANAALYAGPDARIEIAAHEQQESVQLTVTDNGPGIDPADLDYVFDRYYRAKPATSDGQGIGLAIVKQVADAYGNIAVESPLGNHGGTRFTMNINKPAKPPPISGAREPHSHPPQREANP